MDAIDALLTRRSIRKYTRENVSEADVKLLLEAAMAAPSANNKQPWHFIVIRERSVLEQIEKIHPYAAMAAQAPLAILVCGDTTLDDVEGYLAVDCAAATQNILLAAHAGGLGAVWCGVYPREQRVNAFRENFSLPPHILPISFIPIGHPAEDKGPAERYKEERVRQDRW